MNIASLFFTYESEGFNKLGGELQQLGQGVATVGKSLTDNITKPILEFLGKGISVASDINESMNVVSTTFGKNTKEVSGWSKNLIDKFGLTEKEGLEYVGVLGSIFKAQGFTSDETKEFSKGMTELTGDISSFYNLDHEEAFNKIKSGLTGEAEPLKSIGILVDDTTTKQYAMSEGLKENWKDLSQSEKMLWRYKLIMSQTGDSQGDFNKTQDTYGNKLRVVQGKLETFSASLGTVLLPIMETLLGVADGMLDWLNGLGPGASVAVVAIALLVAAIGPLVIMLGGAVITGGLLITAITTIAGVLSLVTLPLLGIAAAITAGLIVWAAWVAFLVVVVAKMGIFKDAISSLKALVSGDANKMFNLLHKNFGMSAEDARIWSKRFGEIAEKAKIVFKVISDNLGPILEELGGIMSNVVSGGMTDLNEGTKESKNAFSDMVTGIIKWGGELIDYIYEILDAFGLIPIEMKFANNKVAGQYARLESTTNSHFEALEGLQGEFGTNMSKETIEMYGKQLTLTKRAMNEELKFVVAQLEKKKTANVTGLAKLFKDTNIMTETQEAESLQKAKGYYEKNIETLKNNNKRIQEIDTANFKAKKNRTKEQQTEIDTLRAESAKIEIQTVSDSQLEQRRIVAESGKLTLQMKREQGLALIVEGNLAFDKAEAEAKKFHDNEAKLLLEAYEVTGSLTETSYLEYSQANDDKYEKAKISNKKLKDDNFNNVKKMADDSIDEKDREKRVLDTKSKAIKEMILKVWEDLQKEIPPIVDQLGKDIEKYLDDHIPQIMAAAKRVGVKLIAGIIAGIVSQMPSLLIQLGIIVTKLLGFQSKATAAIGKIKGSSVEQVHTDVGKFSMQKRASGEMDYKGGWTLVGEEGPEILNLPSGTDIYNNPETKKMLNNTSPTNISTQNSESVNLYGDIVIDSKSVQDFTDIVTLLKGVKRQKSMR